MGAITNKCFELLSEGNNYEESRGIFYNGRFCNTCKKPSVNCKCKKVSVNWFDALDGCDASAGDKKGSHRIKPPHSGIKKKKPDISSNGKQ